MNYPRAKSSISLLSFFFVTMGCDPNVIDITFVNNTDHTLSIVECIQEASDTSLFETTPFPKGMEKTDRIVYPHSSDVSRFFEYSFRNGIKYGCYRFYVFDVDTINTLPWEKIRNDYKIVKRIDIYSMEDIYRNNYVFTIP